MAVLVGRNTDRVAEAARHSSGGSRRATDWRQVIARDDIDLVDICTPGDIHAEIAIAALEAGKHVLCEKPLANTVAEAEAMTAAAEGARAQGRAAMVASPTAGCRRSRWRSSWSATAGRGVRHMRAQYLQDWIVDPECPLSWRLQKERAGSGALGDIGAHIIDLAQFVTGQSVDRGGRADSRRSSSSGRCRPSTGLGRHCRRRTRTGEVTVDDAAIVLGPYRRRGARRLRGHAVRHRAQEPDPCSRSTGPPAAWRSTSRT